MMLSIEKPELCQEALQFPGGIHCIRLNGERLPRIILKLPTNYLLSLKINKGFKIYVIPVDVSGNSSIGLMCAFFDDSDSPLISWRLLDPSDETSVLLRALTLHDALVHVFDEQNRELLGFRANIDMPLMAKIRIEHAKFPDFSHDDFHIAHEQAMAWFGLRGTEDDEAAINVTFVESLSPEDFSILDMRQNLFNFHGSLGFGFTSIERVEPGLYQELDIIGLLCRVFKSEQIYHSPKRFYDKEEIADIIVLTEKTCLIIQAKDSPNTEKSMNRTLERKRLASNHMLKAALNQLSGAVKYIDRNRPLKMIVDNKEIIIDLGNREVLSLAVIRELFLDMYEEYSQEIFRFFDEIGLPCIALDYEELHTYTHFCRDEEFFLRAYFQVFYKAKELGRFPRLRFGINDVEALRREPGISGAYKNQK